MVKAPGDIDKAVLGIQNLYGISPPVAELLANNPRSVLLTGVTSGKHMGTEKVNGVECEPFYQGAPDAKHTSSQDFLIEKLKGAAAKKSRRSPATNRRLH